MSGGNLAPNGLVDLHCHILPGVDDGPKDDGTVLEMLRLASADGISTIVATSHSRWVTPERVAAAVEHVNNLARRAELDVRILPGSEVRYEADLASRWQAGELVAINGTSYVLVEFPYRGEWPPLLATSIYNMQLAGMQPIIAHAERYPVVQRDPASLLPLVEAGVLVQVNGDALLRYVGDGEQATARRLLEADLIHVMASDGHSPEQRPPVLSRALQRVRELGGDAYAERLIETAERIVNGQPVNPPQPNPAALHPPRRFRLPWRRGD